MIKAIEVCEGELHDIHEFETMELYHAFSDGFSAGAGNYGCGSAYTLTIEEIDERLAELTEWDNEKMLRKARLKLEGK